MAPASDSPYKPPQLLHWRGMKRWCVGSRASSLCEMVINARNSSTKLSLQMVGRLMLSSHMRSRGSSSSRRNLQARAESRGDRAPSTSDQASSSKQELDRSASASSTTTTTQRRGGEGKVLFGIAASCSSSSRAGEDVVECTERGRNARVMARSTSCPNPARSYKEGRSSDAIARAAGGILGHSRSSTSYRRFSVDGVGRSSSSSSSRGGGVAKLGGGGSYTRQVSSGRPRGYPVVLLREMERKGTPLVAELLVGNQFLARVNPAPPPSSVTTTSSLSPSPGLLLLKPPPHLADRLIFFA